MDLHDYQDVAENYDRYLEVMYAHDDHHENFQEFYLTARTCRRRCAKWLRPRRMPWACA